MSSSGYFEYSMRTVVHCAADSIIRVPALFEGLGAKRVVLLSDPGLRDIGLVAKMQTIFDHQQRAGNAPQLIGTFDDIGADASCDTVNQALAFVREVSADAILALGGGSVMDAAKGVKYALHHHLSDIREAIQAGIVLESWPKAQPMKTCHIAVPTTAGTGAEVSNGAVFYNEQLGLKCNLLAPYMEADIAVLDPKLTLGLPSSLTASTGMDALTHALEAVASPIANHFSDAHGFAASELIVENLPLAVKEGKNLQARSSMIQASTMAINAFMAALNALPVHNCAHAFGAMFHIPHGDANAVLLPIVIEALPEFYLPRAQRLAKALGVNAPGASDDALLAAVIDRLKQFQIEVGCATDFARWQITIDSLQPLVEAIASDPAAIFFPIPPEKIQVIAQAALG